MTTTTTKKKKKAAAAADPCKLSVVECGIQLTNHNFLIISRNLYYFFSGSTAHLKSYV